MSFREIMVTLEPGPALERRMLHAADLALSHEAHLVGLSVIEPLNLAAYFSPGLEAIIEIEERHLRAAENAARKVEAAFLAICARLGISSEWLLGKGDPADVTVEHARYADLTIVGQVNPENPGSVPGASRELRGVELGTRHGTGEARLGGTDRTEVKANGPNC